MRHLFIIHSHATHRCAHAIIRALGLPPEDCRFGTNRGFEPPPVPEQSATSSFRAFPSLHEPNGNAIRPVLRLRGIRNDMDRQIAGLIGDGPYHCYLPHTYFDPFHFLITHPQCDGFSYIEEGLTSYYEPGEIDAAYPPWRFSRRTRFLRRLVHGPRLQGECAFFSKGHVKAYGFTDHTFPSWPGRITLGIDSLFPRGAEDPKPSPPILVFDALVELGLTTEAALIAALGDFCETLCSQGVTGFHYKLHPTQAKSRSPMAIQSLFSSFRENLSAVALDADYPLEDHFSGHGGPVYVFNSGAGLYAALRGKSVWSLNPLIEARDPDYHRTVARLPAVFHRLVKPCVSRSS